MTRDGIQVFFEIVPSLIYIVKDLFPLIRFPKKL